VAPKLGPRVAKFWAHIKGGNEQANPELLRLALKLATGAGKTTVMAMLIAWQTINAVRHPNSKTFSRGFLIVAPGITIKDRLRVLLPNDPESYYRHREIVPPDLLADIDRAKIVITNYHAFKLRERIEVSKGTREAIEGWEAKKDPTKKLQTFETDGQMLQRVMPELMGMKNIVVINDEAHHCYRERVKDATGETEDDLKGEEKEEAKENNEAARMWISGLETVKRKLGISLVYDLSATPFFLRGSGYLEGTLFPWSMSDFSLMDAIECGIVKLPRVPVADNVPGGDTPKFRNLWDEIKKSPRGLPKKGRSAGANLVVDRGAEEGRVQVLLPKGPRGRRIVPRRVLDDHAAVRQNPLVRRHVDIGKRRAAGLEEALLVPLWDVVVVSRDRHRSDSLDMPLQYQSRSSSPGSPATPRYFRKVQSAAAAKIILESDA
jgi:type III restriction enzyme